MAKEKKPLSKGMKILRIVAIVVVALIVLEGIGIAGYKINYKGYFSKGNGGAYGLNNIQELQTSPLKGMNIAFLGSSVTEGARSKGVSFVEQMARHNGFTYTKEAVSGTTLADINEKSYVQRMLNNLDPNASYDLLICQLSTNDANDDNTDVLLGTVSDSTSLTDFDTTTTIGAMEYIIAYTKETWGCPVVFYTGSRYDNAKYQQMVDALSALQDKWGIGVIDLWNGLDVNIPNYDLYMADSIHPTQAGYLEWWLPAMEAYLYTFVNEQ